MFWIGNHSKKTNGSLRRGLLLRLLCLVILPVLLFGALALLFVSHTFQKNRQLLLDSYMQDAASVVDAHLQPVRDIVTILEDNAEIRAHMKQLSRAQNPARHESRQIKKTVAMPYTYTDAFMDRAISATTVFSGSHLAYYSHSTWVDTNIQRCVDMNTAYQNVDCREGILVWGGLGSPFIYYIKDYRNVYENHYYGRIIVEINQLPVNIPERYETGDTVYAYSLDLMEYPGTQYYLVNGEDTIIMSSEPQGLGMGRPRYLAEDLTKNMAVQEGRVADFDARFVLTIPESALRQVGGGVSAAWVVLGATLLALYLIIVTGAFLRLLEPFKQLRYYYKTTQEYPLTMPSFSPEYDEIEEVTEIIQNRINDINALKTECDELRMRQKDTEIQTLQGQMRPHFLFNMLDTIGWKAAKSGYSEVNEMVSRLGEMLRSDILYNEEQKFTLRQELQYSQNYLMLQQLNNPDSFIYTFNVDDDLLDHYYIPKLTIQPIVENSVLHGFKNLDRQGVIKVDIWEDIIGIYISIQDNGVGFDPVHVFDGPETDTPDINPGNHVALNNINNRIKLLYGEKYAMTIKSELGFGTTVVIKIPYDKGGPQAGGEVQDDDV